jgi:hypothetical protein
VVRFADGTVEAQVLATKPQPAPIDTTSTDRVEAAHPLVREISLHARRGWWGRFEAEVSIPAWQGTERSLSAFVLESDSATPALATIDTPRVWNADPARREYPVHITHLRGGHSYTGTVQLGADTASTVALTVHASHSVVYFLLAVAAGVIAGLMVRRWTDLGRPISLMRERVIQARPLFVAALDAHAAAGWPRKRLATEFDERQPAVDAQVRALSLNIVKNDDVEQEFAAVRASIEALEGLAPALAKMTAELTALKALRGEISESIGPVESPPGDDESLRKLPAALAATDTTLTGMNLTLATLESAVTDVASQRTFLARWAAVLHDALEVKRRREALGAPWNEDEAEVLEDAEIKVYNILGDLWKVRDSASLDEVAPPAAIAEAEHALRAVAVRRRKAEAAGLAEKSAQWMDGEATPTSGWELKTKTYQELPLQPAAQENLLRRLWNRRRLVDWALATAAVVVSLLTTLSTHYLNGPFGTLSDYVAVLGWSFGLTSALTLLATGLATLQTTGLRTLLRR